MPSKTIETSPQKFTLEAIKPELAAFFGATIGDGFSCAKGDTLGIVTSSGFVRKRTKTTVDTTAFATDSTTGKLADVSPFKAGDVLKNAAGQTIGTIQSINTATRVITLTGNAAVAVANGAGVYGSDGSQVAKGFADEGSDGDGVTQIPVCIGGYLEEANLNGLDSTAKTELGGISTVGGIFKF